MKEMKGFTLIEVLVSALILGFLISGIYMVLNIGDKTYRTDMGLLDLQQQARQAMNQMTREIRQSDLSSVSIGITGENITFSIPQKSNIYYYLDDNSHQIIRQQPAGTGTTKVLANDIGNLNFSHTDSFLQIQLTATKTVMLRTLSVSLTEKVNLRN